MPKVKKIAATLAISTALTGGVVGLGAATTTTSANAGVSVVALGGCGGGHGCGNRCGGGSCGGGGCGGNWGHKRWTNRSTVKINHVTGNVRWRHARGCLHIRKNFEVLGGSPTHW
ncbi:hypothetical protein [Spongiactinospora sp. TRM90649]|uniref:hypothetical protein n=1 Tax=Spongiactinospora sp. TRM90649 TaxID=3031114 RepID=UPI0023F932E5|nr:hypothetical protein [Spongiactinospora sp. TRM90649]MDF5755506.1 hypothetical protein [Spongiactinospora sp. TRM90649]